MIVNILLFGINLWVYFMNKEMEGSGTMIRHLRFIFGLIMLSVFVAGMGIILIMSAPQVAA